MNILYPPKIPIPAGIKVRNIVTTNNPKGSASIPTDSSKSDKNARATKPNKPSAVINRLYNITNIPITWGAELLSTIYIGPDVCTFTI